MTPAAATEEHMFEMFLRNDSFSHSQHLTKQQNHCLQPAEMMEMTPYHYIYFLLLSILTRTSCNSVAKGFMIEKLMVHVGKVGMHDVNQFFML